MTLEEFYSLNKSGTRVFDLDDNEIHIDQHTKTYLYEVIAFDAKTDDLIFVWVS